MVIASIDLMNRKVVQLRQGRAKVLEYEKFLPLVKEFDKYGEIAVIDLDSAMARGDNSMIVREILRRAECRVGGGVRSVGKAKELIGWGARKVIIGSQAFEGDRVNHRFLQELSDSVGRERIIVAIDAWEGQIVTHGWQHKTGLDFLDVTRRLEKYCAEFLFTCVECEGLLRGINVKLVRRLAEQTKKRITVAGGVRSIDEIRQLSKLGVDVQLGMALYTRKVGLGDAFIESLSWRRTVIPTITQDQSGQVLMLAYSNRLSLKKTFETGRMWYFSRSRNRLWMKGETSGNSQELIRLRSDCDQDSLLATVKQKGVACHTGIYSCFGDKKFSLDELYRVIKDRVKNPRPGSYTASLTGRLLRRKILEEAREVVAAKSQEEIIWKQLTLFIL